MQTLIKTRTFKSQRPRSAFLAWFVVLALVSAACGSTGGADGSALVGDDSASEEQPETDSESESETTSEPETDSEPETTSEPETESESETTSESETDSDNPADAAVNGVGAASFYDKITDPPGPADQSLEPVVFSMVNQEGNALGSFPEIREGLEIAVAQINEELGGIGGRPVQLDTCVHGFDPNAAVNCANDVAQNQPHLNISGISFFSSAIWPALVGNGVPSMQTAPLVTADFVQVGIPAAFGGCALEFQAASVFTVETLNLDEIAVVYSNTPAGIDCFNDSQLRFWDHLGTQNPEMNWAAYTDNPGDPADNGPLVQAIADQFADVPAEDAGIYLGMPAADCNALLSAIQAAGVEAQVIASGSCVDDTVLDNPASAGVTFGQQGYLADRPEFYDEFSAWELGWRDQALEVSPVRQAPVSALMWVGHAHGIFAWEVLNGMVEEGEDIDDRLAVTARLGTIENQHIIGSRPLTCTDNSDEYPAICRNEMTFHDWDGETWTLGVLDGELINVAEIQAQVADASPREQ